MRERERALWFGEVPGSHTSNYPLVSSAAMPGKRRQLHFCVLFHWVPRQILLL